MMNIEHRNSYDYSISNYIEGLDEQFPSNMNDQYYNESYDYQNHAFEPSNYIDQYNPNSLDSYPYSHENSSNYTTPSVVVSEPTYYYYDFPSYEDYVLESGKLESINNNYKEDQSNNRKRSNSFGEQMYEYNIGTKKRFNSNDEVSFENSSLTEDQNNNTKINKNREAARKFRKKRQIELEELKLRVKQLHKENKEYAKEEQKIKEENEKKTKEAEELYNAIQTLITYTFSQISSSQCEQIFAHMKANNILKEKM